MDSVAASQVETNWRGVSKIASSIPTTFLRKEFHRPVLSFLEGKASAWVPFIFVVFGIIYSSGAMLYLVDG